jgi:hypothetical protein
MKLAPLKPERSNPSTDRAGVSRPPSTPPPALQVRRDALGYDVRKPEALTLRLVPETEAAHVAEP